MTGDPGSSINLKRAGRRAGMLAALVALQALAAMFFVLDAVQDIRSGGLDSHSLIEAGVSLALLIGVGFGIVETRRMIERARRAERAVSAASGLMDDLIEDYFARWELTPAEADVALFCLKGLDVAEIAELRASAQGTVRAQLTRVYAKASVSNRSQLVGLFLEDLLGGPIVPHPDEPISPSAQ